MLRLYDVRYIMNLWICIILFKKKKIKQTAMTVELTNLEIHDYESYNYFCLNKTLPC